MGKERATATKHAQRHTPLHKEYASTGDGGFDSAPARKKYSDRAERRKRNDNQEFIDPSISRKILAIAKEQQDELRDSLHYDDGLDEESVIPELADGGADFDASDDEASHLMHGSDEEPADDDEDISFDGFAQELDIDANDQAVLDRFMPSGVMQRRNLADIVMEKIRQHTQATQNASAPAVPDRPVPPSVNPKVVEVYSQVGKLLSRYKSGKLPKAFKIIPSLPNWEEVLYLTRPEKWTPHAVYQATRIFVSNLKAKQSQRFFTYVLLDRVREDIDETKKLNYHLYMALKKALYKPAAFFKGILFPLCESGTCTLREAAIVGSVLAKVSVPVLHSGAALMRLADMEYTGPTSLFMRILFDKKYALPFKVVDAVVFHFLRFKTVSDMLPVLWHQALLTFCQRYKQDLTPEQKDALMGVLRQHTHHQITAEIRREIVHSSCRGELLPSAENMLLDE